VAPGFEGEPPQSVRSFRRFSWSCYRSGVIGVDSANRLHGAVKLSARVRADLLDQALDTLARHRDAVRARVETVAGEPVLHFDARPRFERMRVDGADAAAALSAFVWRPFDLDKEGLFRALLVEIDGQSYMAIAMHHLVSDATSFGLLWREFWRNYRSHARCVEPSPPKGAPYGGYLNGLNTWRQTPQAQAQISNLAARVAPLVATRPTLSTAGPLAPTPIRIEGDLLARLRLAATQAKVTPFCMLLAAQAGALIERRPGQPALIASVHSGRDHPALLETIGYLADRSFYLIAPEHPTNPAVLVSATWRAIVDVARDRFVRFDFLRDHLATQGVDLVTPYFNFAAMPRPSHRVLSPDAEPPPFPLSLATPIRLDACPVFSGSGPDTCDYGLTLVEKPGAIEGQWIPKAPTDAALAERFLARVRQLAAMALPR
ncbi:MAG TPA: condensation domain-containing protein, partial [Caulobacter sp.]|nr:condensation domain-containing protein [Caulobacter sp.]